MTAANVMGDGVQEHFAADFGEAAQHEPCETVVLQLSVHRLDEATARIDLLARLGGHALAPFLQRRRFAAALPGALTQGPRFDLGLPGGGPGIYALAPPWMPGASDDPVLPP